MLCVICKSNTVVINSRSNSNKALVWRRRSCYKCKNKFSTYEEPSIESSNVIKSYKSKKMTNFNLGVLIISISRSFLHDQNKGDLNSYWLAKNIETKLMSDNELITLKKIKAVTHKTLCSYDKKAAVQYAARHDLLNS